MRKSDPRLWVTLFCTVLKKFSFTPAGSDDDDKDDQSTTKHDQSTAKRDQSTARRDKTRPNTTKHDQTRQNMTKHGKTRHNTTKHNKKCFKTKKNFKTRGARATSLHFELCLFEAIFLASLLPEQLFCYKPATWPFSCVAMWPCGYAAVQLYSYAAM